MSETEREKDVAYVKAWINGFAEAKGMEASELIAQLANGHQIKPSDLLGFPKARGPYKKRSAKSIGVSLGWGAMTKAERSKEMQRRMRVAKGLEAPRPRPSQRKRPMGGVA
jgi:hypothetical protein